MVQKRYRLLNYKSCPACPNTQPAHAPKLHAPDFLFCNRHKFQLFINRHKFRSFLYKQVWLHILLDSLYTQQASKPGRQRIRPLNRNHHAHQSYSAEQIPGGFCIQKTGFTYPFHLVYKSSCMCSILFLSKMVFPAFQLPVYRFPVLISPASFHILPPFCNAAFVLPKLLKYCFYSAWTSHSDTILPSSIRIR